MEGQVRDDEIRVGGDARQRFHDSRGYGRPTGGNEIALSRVEAAHLLLRGDLDAVDGMDFRAFLAGGNGGFGARFLVYTDLRDRGFYLSPDREGWVADPGDADFVVYPRGQGPGDGEVHHRVRVVDERADLAASDLGEVVLAVVDEESEITYFETGWVDPAGESDFAPDAVAEGSLLDDRVVLWDPPADLHAVGFYGQPLGGRAAEYEGLQLSLLEAAYLGAAGDLTLAGEHTIEDVVERGRAVEGERFDRRLRVYRSLRDRDMVPKTGFKFGADFRVYADVASVDDLGHSELLVRALPAAHTFSPRDLALDVRLAHGVRKRMVFALDRPNDDTIRWLSASRLTP